MGMAGLRWQDGDSRLTLKFLAGVIGILTIPLILFLIGVLIVR